MKRTVQGWLAAAAASAMLLSMAASLPACAEEIDRSTLSVLILGDDISAGTGLSEGESAYGELVASYLGAGTVWNYAQEGATTQSLLEQIQTDETVQASIAQADVILISIGSNDIYQAVLQNEYIDISQFSTMQAVLNNLDSNTRLSLSKYLRSAMPPVVEQANSNLQSISSAIYAANTDADIVFQEIYNPLSASQDTTNLTGSAPVKLAAMSPEVDEYLQSGGLIPTGVNTKLDSLQQAKAAGSHALLLNHAWYYTGVASLSLQPNAIGQLALAQAAIQALDLPAGDGTSLASAYESSGASQTLSGVDETLDQALQSLGASEAATIRKGDVDSSGSIDMTDATLALTQYAEASVANAGPLNALGKKAADVNGTGETDLTDATLLLTFYAEKSVGNVTEDEFDEFIVNHS